MTAVQSASRMSVVEGTVRKEGLLRAQGVTVMATRVDALADCVALVRTHVPFNVWWPSSLLSLKRWKVGS